ncbi:MAG: sigma-54 dependent transcriptional regulator [Ignavibacteriaceae bacterium]|nr:sigma-54 dependent transcriptional regulator [Ignavibacteriaceae bacterium]
MNDGNILIIDDEVVLRNLISRLLRLENLKTWEASLGKEALDLIEKEEFQVIITDVRLPDIYGIDLIPLIKKHNPLTEIIVLTAYGTIEDGVKAIKAGAFDYITKGDEDNKIVPVVLRALEKAQMSQRLKLLEKKVSDKFSFENIIGNSSLLKEAVELAIKVAATDAPVLLSGETGTGKEVFAQAIHYSSSRKNKPFVIINCSAISKDLLESEMFGYKAGAFTGAVKNKKGLFEEAHTGTLFLDEIGEMDFSLQAKLLRVLESNTFIKPGDTKTTQVDVRIIAATNRNLEEEIIHEKFRQDLFYRLSVFRIELPSLRNRKEDIPILAQSFVDFFSKKMNKNIKELEPAFISRLKDYSFPGNIREMKNLIERAIILADSDILKESYLPREFLALQKDDLSDNNNNDLTMEQIEKRHIINTLNKCDGNKTRAAEMLGIGLTTLYRKLQSYGIE